MKSLSVYLRYRLAIVCVLIFKRSLFLRLKYASVVQIDFETYPGKANGCNKP